MLKSSVISVARTEKREAYRASKFTIGTAMSTPANPPLPHKIKLSASSERRIAAGVAPSAERIANSDSLRTVRARIRFATFEHAITNNNPEAANKTHNTVDAFELICWCISVALIVGWVDALYVSGCAAVIALYTVRSCA